MNYFEEHYKKQVTRKIRNEISEYFSINYDKNNKRKISDVEHDDGLSAHMFKRSKADNDTVCSEFERYLNFPLSDKDVDTVEYWKSHQQEYPNLSRMARDFCPLQSGSVSTERDFSGAVDLITPNRCALTKDIIRANMCLKSWYRD